MDERIVLESAPIDDDLLDTASIEGITARLFQCRVLQRYVCPQSGQTLMTFSSAELAAPQSVLGPRGSKGGA